MRPDRTQGGAHPGAAALAAFPHGPGSFGLGLCAADSTDALLALLVFSGILALLPDSRWPERLLTLTVALLLLSLTALRRVARGRGSEGAPALSDSTAAADRIDLDEAERALAGRPPEGD